MYRGLVLLLLTFGWCGCKPTEESHMKAIAGAVLIDGLGGPPLANSVVVVAGGRIREAGAQSNIVIPAEADKIDGAGKYLVPAPIDVFLGYGDRLPPPTTVEEARARVAQLAAQKARIIHIWKMEPAIVQAALEAARDAGIGAIGHIATEAEARVLVDNGAAGFVGMITDTENLDPVLVARMRDLRIFFAPALATAGAQLAVAERNTRRLYAAGVPIAAASNGASLQAEMELLVEAGIPPLDAIVAATRNGAAALRRLDEAGTIQSGKRADLLLLSANPGADIRNLTRVALRMSGGEWVR